MPFHSHSVSSLIVYWIIIIIISQSHDPPHATISTNLFNTHPLHLTACTGASVCAHYRKYTALMKVKCLMCLMFNERNYF